MIQTSLWKNTSDSKKKRLKDKGEHLIGKLPYTEPTVNPLDNNKIDFKISFDESDDEDYMIVFDENSFSCKIIYVDNLKTDSENENDKINIPSSPSPEPTIGYFDDLDFFKSFENEFPAIVYNDLKSKSDPLNEPSINMEPLPHHDLRHSWLKYQVDGYDEGIIHSYEQRLGTISGRPVNRVHMLDFVGLKNGMRYTLGDRLSMEEMAELGFGAYWSGSERVIPNKGDLRDYWMEGLRGLLVVIDLHKIARLNICSRFGDTWAWLAPRPERQQAAAAGASRAAKDASTANKECFGLRGIIKSSITEQTRVSTWMISYMTHLMDASVRTYQAFDSAFVDHSRLSYERHVRPRTGDASTSSAPQTNDQPYP
nr:hypothetical protein [Tanacetum cinerariifolium]